MPRQCMLCLNNMSFFCFRKDIQALRFAKPQCIKSTFRCIHFDFLVEKLMLPCYCSSSPSQCVRLPPKRQTQECAFRSSSWLVSLFTTLSQHSLHPALICRLVIARRFTCSVFLDAIHSPHIQPRIRLRRINQVLQKNCEVLVIKAIFLFGK